MSRDCKRLGKTLCEGNEGLLIINPGKVVPFMV